MVLMRNATGNVYKYVPQKRVDDYLHKGFLIVGETEGGISPPSTPLQEEQTESPITELEPPIMVEEDYNHRKLKSNGRYWNQLNVPESKEYCVQEALSYPEDATLKVLRGIIGAYVKTLPQNR